MENMAYCLWENTHAALRECVEHVDDDLSGTESAAREAVLYAVTEMLEIIGVTVDRRELYREIMRLSKASRRG